MITRSSYTLFLKFLIFVSILNTVFCYVCTIQGSCKCQIRNISDSTVLFLNNGSQLFNDSSIINICRNLNFTNPNGTDPSFSSNLKYEMACNSLFKLNDSHSKVFKPIQYNTMENDTNLFTLLLQYPCDTPADKAKGYSTGSILIIIFFTLFFAYLGVGICVNYFLVGARGIEMMPNLDFWKDFPLLVLDGVKFLQNGCTARPSDLTSPSGAEGYDAI